MYLQVARLIRQYEAARDDINSSKTALNDALKELDCQLDENMTLKEYLQVHTHTHAQPVPSLTSRVLTSPRALSAAALSL